MPAIALVLVRSSCCLQAQDAKRRRNVSAEFAATTTHRRYCQLSAWTRFIQLVEQLIQRPLVLNARSMKPHGQERRGSREGRGARSSDHSALLTPSKQTIWPSAHMIFCKHDGIGATITACLACLRMLMTTHIRQAIYICTHILLVHTFVGA
jgi:hypothetical protein